MNEQKDSPASDECLACIASKAQMSVVSEHTCKDSAASEATDTLMEEELDAKASALWEQGARKELGDAEFERLYPSPRAASEGIPERYVVGGFGWDDAHIIDRQSNSNKVIVCHRTNDTPPQVLANTVVNALNRVSLSSVDKATIWNLAKKITYFEEGHCFTSCPEHWTKSVFEIIEAELGTRVLSVDEAAVRRAATRILRFQNNPPASEWEIDRAVEIISIELALDSGKVEK